VADYHLGSNRTGLDAINLVRRHQRRDIPSIILTGDVEIRKKDPEMLPYLEIMHKPVSPPRLRRSLEIALTKAQERASEPVAERAAAGDFDFDPGDLS